MIIENLDIVSYNETFAAFITQPPAVAVGVHSARWTEGVLLLT